MAFNFLGTLSKPELQEFRSFLEEQIVDLDEQINYLKSEMNRLWLTLADFKEADANLGGSATNHLYETQLPLVVKVAKVDDGYAADIMARLKQPFIQTIKFKKERNEYKIKKLLDAIEQTKEMISTKTYTKNETYAYLSELEAMFNNNKSKTLFNTQEDKNNYVQGITKTSTMTTT
jgi:prefoldin subunit 5